MVHSEQETTKTESSSEEYTVHNLGGNCNDLGYKYKIYCQMLINCKWISIEVDPGAEVSIVSKKTREDIFPEWKSCPLNLKLKMYTNELMKVAGTLNKKFPKRISSKSTYYWLQLVMGQVCLVTIDSANLN